MALFWGKKAETLSVREEIRVMGFVRKGETSGSLLGG